MLNRKTDQTVTRKKPSGIVKCSLAFLSVMLAIPTFASIGISPTRIEINANKIRNNYAVSTVEVRGKVDKPVRYRIYAEYFELNSNADINSNVPKDTPHNLSKNLRFVPSEFTVPPGKTQKVRVNVANVKALPDGESRTMLYFEDVEPKEVNVPNTVGIGARLVIKTKIGVPVYVDKGKFTKKADIDYFKINKDNNGYSTEMKILSTGNSKVRYTGRIQIIDGKKLIDEYNLESHVVGHNNYFVAKQMLKTDKIPTSGEYTVRAVITYADENDNKKSIKKETVINYKGEKI